MMKLWNDFKQYFYKKSLSKRLQQINAEHAITNLSDAHSIGILYDSSNPDHDIVITKFAENLRKHEKVVEILGLINDMKTEHKGDISIFNKKNLNWMGIPENEKVEQFAGKKFDLLIASFIQPNTSLEYVVAVSKARWKVGAYAPDKTELYDMMINLHGRNELPYFLEQTTHFLNQIKYDSK
jgi:hypothetical protein